MKKLLRFVVIPVLATALTAMLTVTGASASGTRTFTYLAGDTGDTRFLCNRGGIPCPDAASASSTGDVITISGFGELTIDPKSIGGGGDFTATALVMGGDPVRKKDKGTWEAVELLSFKSYGPARSCPQTFSRV